MSALLEILDKGRPRGLSLAGDLIVRASTAPPRAEPPRAEQRY
jgi:hypothetical protein